MIKSRTFLKIALALGTLTLASLGSGSAALADGPWCASAGGRSSYTNCGYHTFQQCLDSVRGAGGYQIGDPLQLHLSQLDAFVAGRGFVYVQPGFNRLSSQMGGKHQRAKGQ